MSKLGCPCGRLGSSGCALCLREVLATLGWAERELVVAGSFWQRLTGLLFVNAHSQRVMAFPNCSSVHTFGMRDPLDIVFVGTDGKVLSIEKGVLPGRLRGSRRAVLTLEAFSHAR